MRWLVLGAIVAVGASAVGIHAMQTATAPIEIEKLRDNVYLLRGGGRAVQIGGTTLSNSGNSLALVTAAGIVLVDTKIPGWGKPLIEKLREVSDKPVTTIVNTHTHMDHVGGNVEFPATVEVVAHTNTAALMREMRPVAGGPQQPNLFAEHDGRGLPTRTFSDRLTLGAGRDRIDLYYFGRAHTSGDTWVVFPAARVMHAGDVFGQKVVPLLDVNNGASGIEYADTIAKARATLKDIDLIVSGHYPSTLTMKDLATYEAFVRTFVQAVQSAKRSGRTIDAFVAEWQIPERFVKEGYVSMEHLRSIKADVEAIWNETR